MAVTESVSPCMTSGHRVVAPWCQRPGSVPTTIGRKRMTMTTTNVEILRQGWLDAASALAPGLDTLPEFLERGLEAAVIDERLDEQSLLRVVTEVTTAAADSLPAEELYFLTRRLQRAVYE